MRRALLALAAVLLPLLLALLAAILVLLPRQGGLAPFRVPAGGSTPADSDALVDRGRHLAQLGNCIGCHTVRGGEPLAGGRAFKTRYGIVYSSNITPDPEHGIGAWSSEEFRHVMRHGISRNGVLSPVFPYANFRHLEDGELDALLAWLRRATPSTATRQAGDYRFPANLAGDDRLAVAQSPPAADARGRADCARGPLVRESAIAQPAMLRAARSPHRLPVRNFGARNAGWYAPALHGPALARFGGCGGRTCRAAPRTTSPVTASWPTSSPATCVISATTTPARSKPTCAGSRPPPVRESPLYARQRGIAGDRQARLKAATAPMPW